jgi:integrase
VSLLVSGEQPERGLPERGRPWPGLPEDERQAPPARLRDALPPAVLRRFLEEAGLPVDIRFHDLRHTAVRHTAGTLALRQGVPLHTVSRMLGLADPAMTLRRYAHVLEDMRDMRKDAARAMDELL